MSDLCIDPSNNNLYSLLRIHKTKAGLLHLWPLQKQSTQGTIHTAVSRDRAVRQSSSNKKAKIPSDGAVLKRYVPAHLCMDHNTI
jgi:hypothetical protein